MSVIAAREASEMKPHLEVAGVSAFLDAAFPAEARKALGSVVGVWPGRVRMELKPTVVMTRPGGILSGPALMSLADVAGYAVIAAHHASEPMVVTNTLTINFLRPGRFEPVFADADLLKLGRRIATVQVRLWQQAEDQPIALSTVSYALP